MPPTYHIAVRIPTETAERLRQLAAAEHRSINQQIVIAIEEMLRHEAARARGGCIPLERRDTDHE